MLVVCVWACVCVLFLTLVRYLSLIQSLIEQNARALIGFSEINWQMGLLSLSRIFTASFAMLATVIWYRCDSSSSSTVLLFRLKSNEFYFFVVVAVVVVVFARKHTEYIESGNKKLLGTYQLHGISDWAWSNQNALVLLFNFAWYLRFKTPSSY